MCDVALLLVMGLPGAGKTELCSQLADRLPSWRVEHIAFDCEIDEAVFGDSPASWKAERVRIAQKVRSRALELASRPGPPSLLLLDDNFYYRSMRQAFQQVAKDAGCGFACLHLDTPIERCLSRDSRRAATVGPQVIRKMAARFERLDPARVWWEGCCAVLSEESIDWSLVLALVERSRSHKLSREAEAAAEAAAAKSRETCRSNLRHQADLHLRAIFKSRIEGADLSSPEGRRLLARMQRARGQLLASLRSGDLELPPDLELTPDGAQGRLRQLLTAAFEAALATAA